MSRFIPMSSFGTPRQCAAQRGISLIELMVAMVIGLVVVGAVFSNYISNVSNARQTAALAQVTSDATLVLGILRNHIAIAGYGNPISTSTTPGGGIQTDFTGNAILGCDNGFTDTPPLSCATTSATPANALQVSYVNDADISPTATDDEDEVGPTDCTGAAVIAEAGTPAITLNRFQIDPAPANRSTPPTLRCHGNGAGHFQPLVDNVESIHLRYGIGGIDTAGNGKMLRVLRYVKASEVGPLSNTAAWNRVLAVRVCVVVSSFDEVLPQPTKYMNCDQTASSTPNDRRIYRAFTTTVLVNNRLSSRAFDPT